MTITIDMKLRLLCDDEIALGPGKADLLEAIAHTGSISAAARSLDMSYRRAWLLVDAMNRCFREPLVIKLAGGKQGGGANVTPAGQAALACYRKIQAEARRAVDADLDTLASMLKCPL